MNLETSKKILHSQAKQRLGCNLKELRLSLGLSQEELGLRIDADQAYISRLESGLSNPTLESIAEIANALESDLKDLLAP